MKLSFSLSQSDLQETTEPAVRLKPAKLKKEAKEIERLITIDDAITELFYPNDELDTTSKIGVDTETTGLRVRHGDMPWMVTLSDMHGNSWACIWAVDPYTRRVSVVKDKSYFFLKKLIEDDTIVKVYFNAKYDMRMLKKIGITHKGRFEEVALKARIYNTDELVYKLKPLSRKYCGLKSEDEKELKDVTKLLQRRAKSHGFLTWHKIETTNSAAKKDNQAPDYWLCQYAHLLSGEADSILSRGLAEEYGRKDTVRTVFLDKFYDETLDKDEARKRFYEFELELHDLVMEMEDTGIRTHKDVAIAERERCIEETKLLEDELKIDTNDPEFNPNSAAKVSRYMFSPKPKGLGLTATEFTDTGQAKTGYKEIEQFSYLPFVQKLFACKAKSKAVTLFFDKYIDNLIPYEDYYVINPEINQGQTRTFRFSMSNPNLQQAANPETSARGADVVQVRNAFGPRPGYVWWLYDYSGQELRLLGGLMKIRAIIEAVKNNEDIPTILGNKTWGGRGNNAAILQAIDSLELNQLHPSSDPVASFWQSIGFSPRDKLSQQDKMILAEQVLRDFNYDIVKLEKNVEKKTVRTRTKMCLYGKAYGAGVNGVVGLLRCVPELAGKWLKELDTAFPEMKRVSRRWADLAAQQGYIENAYGRKLTVPNDRPYVATNYKIQGTAAEMMKISMLRCSKFLKETKLDGRVILTVHDELIFEIRKEHSYKWLLRALKEIMEDHEEAVHIPMSVGISKVVHSWDQEQDFDHLFSIV